MAGNIKLEVTKIRSCSRSKKINKIKPLSKLKSRKWQYLAVLFAVGGNVDISLESSCKKMNHKKHKMAKVMFTVGFFLSVPS